MLVYSLDCADQNGNAARVAYHGLGIVGNAQQNDASRVGRHIQTLLTDKAYRSSVERMRECFLTYGQENRAVEFVEDLLREQLQQRPLMEVGPP